MGMNVWFPTVAHCVLGSGSGTEVMMTMMMMMIFSIAQSLHAIVLVVCSVRSVA